MRRRAERPAVGRPGAGGGILRSHKTVFDLRASDIDHDAYAHHALSGSRIATDFVHGARLGAGRQQGPTALPSSAATSPLSCRVRTIRDAMNIGCPPLRMPGFVRPRCSMALTNST